MTDFPASVLALRDEMEPLTPSPWCESLPYQPLYWDNTNLQTAMHCWRHFYLSAIRGLRPGSAGGPVLPQGEGSLPARSVHLTFGSLLHEAADLWAKVTATGADAETAELLAVKYAMEQSWPAGAEYDVFGGRYARVWQCFDRTRANAAKGIARCAWSKGEHLGDVQTCPECGRPATTRVAYICGEKVKNRRTLLRAVVALCEHLAASSLRPVILPDGRVASELRWFRPLHLQSPDGKPYMITGSFDRIDESEAEGRKVREFKTTQREPSAKYFAGLTGSPQVLTYTWGAQAQHGAYTQVLLTVLHLGIGFAEVYVRPVYHSPQAIAEWQEDMGTYIHEAEIRARLALARHSSGLSPETAYPRRLSACASLPGAPTTPCPFQGICSMSPQDREDFLAANYHRETWNPIGVKGVEVEA